MSAPIHHTFAPHVDSAYFKRAVALNLTAKMRRGPSGVALKNALAQKFDRSCFLFSTGRESLLTLLRAMEIKSGEEIILQGYTCVVLPNAIHAAGAVPIYADIDPDTLNLDIEETRKRITPRTRAIICQHTFGIPAQTDALRKLCDEHEILLIEDCAHVLPDASGPSDIGTHGDVLLLSFGRDKAISGISGGAVLTRNPALGKKLEQEAAKAVEYSRLKLVQWMNYVQFYYVCRPIFNMGGKAILKLARMTGFLTSVVERSEKHGAMSPVVHTLPNMCADLALFELEKLQAINDHRRMLTAFYLDHCNAANISVLQGVKSTLPLQKFPLFVKNASGIRAELKKQNIHLDDGWTGCVICPASTEMESMNYTEGSDPEAEKASQMILSLPTHPTMSLEQAKRLIEKLKRLID